MGHTALLSGPEKNLVGWTEAEGSLTPGRSDVGSVPGRWGRWHLQSFCSKLNKTDSEMGAGMTQCQIHTPGSCRSQEEAGGLPGESPP